MNLDDFSTVVDDRRYINPQVSLDEQNAFINNLRSTQQARNGEIAADTYNLGTAVPSNLGGLGGSGSYFNARYQTPQTNAVVADLRAAAQAQALNDAMNNELAQAQQRYNNAYKAYQRRVNSNPTTTDDPGNDDDLVNYGGLGDIDPNGLDTVTKHAGDSMSGVGAAANALNNSPINAATGGGASGKLPVYTKKNYSLRNGNGNVVQLSFTNDGISKVLDTPTQSIGGRNNIKSYIGNMASNGYRIYDGNGVDVSHSYIVDMGL